ncbi:MAG: hypothetical protein AB7N24_22160 [Dehalococcoidia bacterium]
MFARAIHTLRLNPWLWPTAVVFGAVSSALGGWASYVYGNLVIDVFFGQSWGHNRTAEALATLPIVLFVVPGLLLVFAVAACKACEDPRSATLVFCLRESVSRARWLALAATVPSVQFSLYLVSVVRMLDGDYERLPLYSFIYGSLSISVFVFSVLLLAGGRTMFRLSARKWGLFFASGLAVFLADTVLVSIVVNLIDPSPWADRSTAIALAALAGALTSPTQIAKALLIGGFLFSEEYDLGEPSELEMAA